MFVLLLLWVKSVILPTATTMIQKTIHTEYILTTQPKAQHEHHKQRNSHLIVNSNFIAYFSTILYLLNICLPF